MKTLKLREEMDEKYLWNLSEMYLSDEAWEDEYTKTIKELSNFVKYKGLLSQNGELLFKALKEKNRLEQIIGKLYVYAKLKFRQDMKNSFYLGLSNKADAINVNYLTIVSFFIPEIIGIGEEKINSFISSTESLKLYKHFFHNIFREIQHKLSHEKEELIAKVTELSNIPNRVFTIVNNVETKFELAKDKDGLDFEITHGNYLKIMESKDRILRKNVYNSYYNYFISRKETMAELYSGLIKKEFFFAKERKYSSSIEASLSENNIPIEVYDTLLNTVNSRLNLSQRFTIIRKKFLKLDVVKPYDVYLTLIENIDYKVTYEEAKDIILKSLSPMGDEYIGIVKTILNSNWIDVYENQNKMSGAFSWGSYGTPPYILMNYVDNLRSLFTLTHELGHSVHSYYSRNNQPFVYGHYTIFLAEVASTLHENLLIDYLLKTTEDSKFKKYVINYYLTNFYATFFRQTMFAEFEKEAHKLVETGTLINSEAFSSIYKGLIEKYFGLDFEIDDKVIYEWTRIPHFYRGFYVYQYATGFDSSVAIGKAILENKPNALEGYIEMLKSGSSDYSIPLLKKAGVDMTTSKPIEDALDVFEELLNKFEIN